MSFGFSPADLFSLIKLAKTTYDDCRKAPQHFGEAGRGARSLHLVFQSLESEISNPESLLNRDEQCKAHIADIAKNCKIVLSQLDGIVLKYASLGSTKIKPWDRFRLPRKEILEIQGKLRFHQSHLISYLETVGVSALGRVEQKFELAEKSHEEVMEKFEVASKFHEEVTWGLDAILQTVDQIGAEIRAGMHPESIFSDHPEDDKEVWKTLRKKLIQQGFTSKFIQAHEETIVERVKEMNDLGLLDSDAQVSSDDVGFDSEVPFVPNLRTNTTYQSATVVTDIESGFESEATLPPRPSKQELRRTTSCNTVKNSKRASVGPTGKPVTHNQKLSVDASSRDMNPPSYGTMRSDSQRAVDDPVSQASTADSTSVSGSRRKRDHQQPSSTSPPDVTNGASLESPSSNKGRHQSCSSLPKLEGSPSRRSSPITSDGRSTNTQEAPKAAAMPQPQKMRVWTGKDSRLKLKAEFIHRAGNYIHLREGNGDETIILATNLSRHDQEYIDLLSAEVPKVVSPITPPMTPPMTPPIVTPPITPASVRAQAGSTIPVQQAQQGIHIEPEIEILPREKPETFVGKRSRWKPIWKYRTIRSIPYRRKGYDCDDLPLAASKGNYQEVQRLLAKGADIESDGEMVTTTDSDGNTTTTRQRTTTALYRSAMAGYFSVAQLLLDNGANVETNNLLHKLASSGKVEFTRLLLEYNARPSRTSGSSRRTTLHIAAHKGYIGVVDVLLEYDVSINARDKMDETPLYLACMEERHKVVQHLLREGADTSILAQDGQTALYKASGRGYTDIVRALLNYSADPNLGRGVSGETVLFKAVRKGYADIVHQLLRYGADPNLANDTKDWAAGSTLDTVILLLKPEEDAKNTYGLRPLYAAAEAGDVEIVSLLLEHGASVDLPSPRGETPLYAAARKTHRAVVDVLMRAGAQLAPQAQVDDVLKLMNSGEGQLTRGKQDKPKRVEMISVLLGRFSSERLSRGVDAWKKGEAVQGADLVAEMVRQIGKGRGESLRKAIL